MILVSVFSSNPLLMSLYQSSETMISIILNLFAGAFADNASRKKILIVTDLLSGITCMIGFIFLATPYLYITMLLGNIILAILSTYNSPSYNAMIKESISEEYIENHFSRFTVAKEIFSIVSPTIGVFIWQLFGIKVSYLFNATTFLFSAYISSKIVIQYSRNKVHTKEFIFRQILDGIRYIYKHKRIMCLLIISAMVNFFLSGYNLTLPYLNNYFSKEMSNFFGAALISESIGAILLSTINNKLLKNSEKNGSQNMMLFFLCLSGLSIVLLPIQDLIVKNVYLSLVPFSFVGGFLTLFNIQFFTIVQKSVDSNYVGRVYSVIFTFAVLFVPIGSLLFGFIFNDKNLFVMLVSGIGIITTVLFYKILSKFRKDFSIF